MLLTDSYSLFHKINTILPRDPNSVDQFTVDQLQTYRIRSIAGPRYVVCYFDLTHTLLLNIGPFDSQFTRLSVHLTILNWMVVQLTVINSAIVLSTAVHTTVTFKKRYTRLTEHTIERTIYSALD